ncbi:MAG: protease pro-enzyme activation domain-containing protein, partial [Solirubrobacteraceae bacterium]
TRPMLNRHRAIHLAALATTVACLGLTVAEASASAPASSLVGDTPMLMRGTLALGNVAPSKPLRLTVVLAPRDPAALAAFATAVSTPGSAEYHHYLTTRQFAKRFGAARASVEMLRSALRRGGLRPGALAPDALSIGVSGSAATISRAFSVTLRRYREPGGASVFANTAPARLPGGLRNVVKDVLGLSDVQLASPSSLLRGPLRKGTLQLPLTCPPGSPDGPGPYTITQIASAYGMNVFQTEESNAGAGPGAGVTIALYELEPYTNQASDWAGYTTCFGRSSTNPVDVEVDGGPPANDPQSGETALDLDVASGLASASNIKIYQGPNSGTGPYDTLQAIVDDPSVSVVSDSWGLCELDSDGTLMSDENTLLQQAATEHQSWLVAAGDSGSYACNATGSSGNPGFNHYSVSDPASQPFATGVGGTSLNTGSSPSETVWNTGGHATGGGISVVWGMPAYQTASDATTGVLNADSSGTPCGAATGYCREVPDVSGDANPSSGYYIYYSGGPLCNGSYWCPYGGTSASAPLWAGLTALADASNAGSCSPSHPLGFLNPSLYTIAAGANARSAFNDVATSGNNNISGSGMYPVLSGYDMATGLGSPIAAGSSGLVAQLCNAPAGFGTPPTVTGVSPSDATPGSTVTITGTAFTAPASVDFGSTAAADVTVVDSAHITATVPAGANSVYVTVGTPWGSSPAATSGVFTYGPVASVLSPSAGATYTQGQLVLANYSCTAWTGASPSCSGPVPSTAPINTATVGAHAFPVSTTDSRGVSAAASIGYTVVAPPQITIATPSAGLTYYRGQKATVSFTCTTTAPVTIASCSGPIANGARLDTASIGKWRFTVAAIDSNGVPATRTVTYTVVSARPSLTARQSASAWVERRRKGVTLPVGTKFSLSLNQPATVTLRIARVVHGRLAGGRCVSAASKGRSCTRNLNVGTLPTVAARAGTTPVAFAGRTSSGTLAPGTYTVTITALGASGQATVARLRFTVR